MHIIAHIVIFVMNLEPVALSQSLPFGHRGLPLRYLKVVSSGATMPALAPASIVMLQTDILASRTTCFHHRQRK